MLLPPSGPAHEAKLIPNRHGELVFSLSEDDARNGWLVDVVDNAGVRNILHTC
jgi:hypothetical protein